MKTCSDIDVRFSVSRPGCDRVHHVGEADVRVVLSRLPFEVRSRLSGVHFNDCSSGGRVLGYVNQGRREIALCALPPRISLARSLTRGQCPKQFGATRGKQWPVLAVRRFMLYDVFLHELGHLQIINDGATEVRRKFAMETKAQQFAMRWCKQMRTEHFDHPDPVHNAPTVDELEDKEPETKDLLRRIRLQPDDVMLLQQLGRIHHRHGRKDQEKLAFEQAFAVDPDDPWTILYLGLWHQHNDDLSTALKYLVRALELMPQFSTPYWCLARVYEAQRELTMADSHYRKAVEVEPADRVARRKLKFWKMRLSSKALT